MSRTSIYNLELCISIFLRVGVLIAGTFLLIGWFSQFQFSGNPLAQFENYQQIPFVDSFTQCWARAEWGLVIAYVGICVLICLPLVRVFMTAVLFFKNREPLMSAAAALVFFALLASFSLGFDL